MKKRFVIFSKPNCPYCDEAKRMIDSYDEAYFEWDISEDGFAKGFLIQSGFTTVPQVYFNGRHIGGKEELENFLGLN